MIWQQSLFLFIAYSESFITYSTLYEQSNKQTLLKKVLTDLLTDKNAI